MKPSLSLVCLFFGTIYFLSTPLFGQEKSDSANILKPNVSDKFSSIDFVFGLKYLASNHFYGQLNTLNNSSVIRPLSYVGFNFVGVLGEKEDRFTEELTYCQIVPQTILIGDASSVKITGFSLGYGVGGDLLARVKGMELNWLVGFNTGRLRLYGNDSMKEKNPFFSPKVSLSPRFKIGKCVLSLRAEYEYDISRKGWRRTYFAKGSQANLQTLNQSGLTVTMGIGYGF
jgi:hypothetical protein